MITKTDLMWWLDLEAELDWRFATTYAEGAPHEYVVAGRTPGLTAEDTTRAAHVIRTFGEPMKFFSSTRIYLTTPMGWKHWDMNGGRLGEETTLINRGRVEHVYGVQNAPRTRSENESAYDPLATTWDRDHAMTSDEAGQVTAMIRAAFGERLGRTLDVGCGTGWLLDVGLVNAVRYTAVDPSTAMLNALVMKHPHVAGVRPMSLREAERHRMLCGTRFDSVVALGGSASYFERGEFTATLERAKRGALLSVYAESEGPPTADLSDARLREARSVLRELADASRASVIRIGALEYAHITTTPH